ncbi:MAG: hypothetical protein KBD76_06245 [Bacteriovorax sp.]|nr:hypothetical protein [Bacteriovorax sp.]
MKLFFLMTFILSLHTTSKAAEESTGLVQETTRYGYGGQERFCSTSAKEKFQELDRITKENVTNLNKKIEEINALKAKKILIADLLIIRNEFLQAANAIQKDLDQTKAQEKKDKQVKIKQLRKLLQSSLSLNAINLLAKNTTPLKEKTTLSDSCNEGKNINSNLCQYVREHDNGMPPSHHFLTLNKTFQNAKMALMKIEPKDQDNTKNELTAIYDSIPAVISPDKILKDLTLDFPEIETCLTDRLDKSSQSCESLLATDNRATLKEKLTNGMSDLHKTLSNTKLDAFFAAFDMSPTPPQKRATYADDLKNMTNKPQQIENILNLDKIKLDLDKKFKILQLTPQELANLKTVCQSDDLQKCIDSTKEMINHFDRQNNEADNEITALEVEIKTLSSNFGPIQMNEKLKQYVAQKYLRTCSNASKSDVMSTVLSASCQPFMALETAPTGSLLEQLSNNVSGIIGAMKASSELSFTRGEVGPFSKDELRSYSTYCQTESATKKDSPYKDICIDVQKASQAIAKVKESKEWAEFNRTHWVEQDPDSEKGYKIYKKRSNGSLFAEAFGKSMNNILPMWMGDMQLQAQIDMLGSQALYQKQLNYMYDFNSPWMTSYFQADYYSGFNNAQMVLGTPGYVF